MLLLPEWRISVLMHLSRPAFAAGELPSADHSIRIKPLSVEEIFNVDIPSLQLPEEPDLRIGILLFNGHFNEGSGRSRRQLASRIESISRAHISDHAQNVVVDWILRNGLISALREALDEFEVPVID
jgi:hypothetical protein